MVPILLFANSPNGLIFPRRKENGNIKYLHNRRNRRKNLPWKGRTGCMFHQCKWWCFSLLHLARRLDELQVHSPWCRFWLWFNFEVYPWQARTRWWTVYHWSSITPTFLVAKLTSAKAKRIFHFAPSPLKNLGVGQFLYKFFPNYIG